MWLTISKLTDRYAVSYCTIKEIAIDICLPQNEIVCCVEVPDAAFEIPKELYAGWKEAWDEQVPQMEEGKWYEDIDEDPRIAVVLTIPTDITQINPILEPFGIEVFNEYYAGCCYLQARLTKAAQRGIAELEHLYQL